MNMIYNGELSSINPVQKLFGGKIIIIRPMILLEEKDTSRYAENAGLPIIKSKCPRNADSKRATIKTIIADLAKDNSEVKDNILKSLHRIKEEYITDILEETSEKKK
jgi:tRNA 2-thiocytidine biosynthesis protein TtcA